MDGERVQLSNKEYMDGHNLNRSDRYVKTKNSHGCFEINSMSCTSVHGLLWTCRALKTWFEFFNNY